jgi:hypothetical protein
VAEDAAWSRLEIFNTGSNPVLTTKKLNNMEDEILNKIQSTYIDCPACEGLTDDEQYTCTTCWYQGGNGRINIFNYIKENPIILK